MDVSDWLCINLDSDPSITSYITAKTFSESLFLYSHVEIGYFVL